MQDWFSGRTVASQATGASSILASCTIIKDKGISPKASSVSKVPTLLACRHENKKRSKNAHFSFEERVKIETYIDEGLSKRKIAERLYRTPKAVRKEIARNSVRGRYCALKAQMKSYQRRWRIQKDVLKIAVNSLLQKYVETHLKQYWSPESISGRLRYVDRHLPYVGKDAIYAYVASVHGRSLGTVSVVEGQEIQTAYTERGDIKPNND